MTSVKWYVIVRGNGASPPRSEVSGLRRRGMGFMSATGWVEGNPGNEGGNVLLLGETCAEAESNYLPKRLTRMREALRSRHYSRRTGQAYCGWVKRFIVMNSSIFTFLTMESCGRA